MSTRSTPPRQHCLVTGATGYIGSRLVAALARAGTQVTATARDTRKLDTFDFPDTVRRVELDVADADSCAAAFNDAQRAGRGPVTTAYFLVHSIGEGAFAEQDLHSARTFADATRDAGVQRLVYLGGFVPDDTDLSEHLESRADVGDTLADTQVDLVWLRAAIVLGAGSTSFELIRHLADRLPLIPLPSWMHHPVSPIAVDNVLQYLQAAAWPGQLAPGNYDISNGESPTYAELIRAYVQTSRRRRLWLRLPAISPRLVAAVVSWISPLPRELTRDLVLSLPNTMTARDQRIRASIPDPPAGLTSIADAFRRASEPGPIHGVYRTLDPLRLVSTDPPWSG